MAEPKTYVYESEIDWTQGVEGKLYADGLPSVECGAPPEFSWAHRSLWSPEQLFVASLNSCYMLTFLAIARRANVEVGSYSASGKLEMDKGGHYQISQVILRPRIVIVSANDLSRMPDILSKTKDMCFISNSIKSAIKVLPEIFHRQTPASPCPLGDTPSVPNQSHTSWRGMFLCISPLSQ